MDSTSFSIYTIFNITYLTVNGNTFVLPNLLYLKIRNRWYSSELGRFISRDPMGYDAGDVNLYRFVGNNSVNGLDPMGLRCCLDKFKVELVRSPFIQGEGNALFNMSANFFKAGCDTGGNADCNPQDCEYRQEIKFSANTCTGGSCTSISPQSLINPTTGDGLIQNDGYEDDGYRRNSREVSYENKPGSVIMTAVDVPGVVSVARNTWVSAQYSFKSYIIDLSNNNQIVSPIKRWGLTVTGKNTTWEVKCWGASGCKN